MLRIHFNVQGLLLNCLPRIWILVLRIKSDWIYYETGLPQNKVSTYAERRKVGISWNARSTIVFHATFNFLGICYTSTEIRVSVQGVKSLSGHFACLCRRFEFYEVNKKKLLLFFKKKMEILLHFLWFL